MAPYAKNSQGENKRSLTGHFCRAVVCALLIVMPLLTMQQLNAIEGLISPQGNPTGVIRAWFRFTEDGGSRPENYANYHVCSSPAYSQSNFIEFDSALQGASGTPSYVTADLNQLPSLEFTRANSHRLLLGDNSVDCTTGNDPYDHASTSENLIFSAWVSPVAPGCADIGKRLTVFGKWDGSSNCSYWIYLQAVDVNGGGCTLDREVEYAVATVFDDAGASFSCASPCLADIGAIETFTTTDTKKWNHIAVSFEPDSTTSHVKVYLNGQAVASDADAATCNNGAAIADPFQINGTSQNLFIGAQQAGTNQNNFDGQIADVKIIGSTSLTFADYYSSNLFNMEFDSRASRAVSSTDPFGTWGYLNSGPATPSPTPDIASISAKTKRNIGSVSLDGVDDYITFINDKSVLPPSASSIETVVVEAWIYTQLSAGDATPQTIMGYWQVNDNAGCTVDTANSSFVLGINDQNKLIFRAIDATDTSYTATSTKVLAQNKWYHVAGVKLTTATGSSLENDDELHVFINGVNDTASTTTMTSDAKTIVNANFSIGATPVDFSTGTCSGERVYAPFKGFIDEPNVWINPDNSGWPIRFNTGIAINEVNFNEANEEIELIYWEGQGSTLDMDGKSLVLCSRSVSSQAWEFDDACGNCNSKVLDPGDLVTLVVQSTGSPVDSSCEGASTSCTWYSANSADTAWAGGDIGTSDGLVLYDANSTQITTQAYREQAVIDAVFWGANQGTCEEIASRNNIGHWQEDVFVDTSQISDATRSIGLRIDAQNFSGVFEWRTMTSNIGSPQAASLTAVELIHFVATEQDNGDVMVEWQTAVEKDTLLFNVVAAEYEAEPKKPINAEPILARGSGALYQVVDTNPNQKRLYWLEEHENDGNINLYGPISLTSAVGDQQEELASSKGTNSPDGAIADNASPSDTKNMNASTGCGRIASSEGFSGPVLCLLLLVVCLVSSRNYRFWQQKDS